MNANKCSIPRSPKTDKNTDGRKPPANSAPLAATLFGAPVAPPPVDVREAARQLYAQGLNVIPLPYGQKYPDYKWHTLKYARLPEDAIDRLFFARCNLAAIAGRTSGNLASLDADSTLAFKLIFQHLRDRGLPIWATQSTRPGLCGHFLFRLADGTLDNASYTLSGDCFTLAEAGQAGAVDVLGHDRLIVLPPSTNGAREFKAYEWHTREGNTVPVYTLADLADLLPELALLQDYHAPRAGVSYGQAALDRECAIVAKTEPGGRNTQLNRSAFALGQLVAGGELNRFDVEYALDRAAHECGLYGPEVRHTIASGLDAGENEPRRRRLEVVRFGATPERATLTAWIDGYDWRTLGRRSTSTRVTAAALADRAGTARNGKWRASIRELAELARQSVKTVQTSLATLQELGAIERAGQDHRSRASLWKLGATAQVKNTPAPANAGLGRVTPNGGRAAAAAESTDQGRPPEPAAVTGSTTLATLGSTSVVLLKFPHDAAERGALGKTGWLVWQFLLKQPEPLTVRAIADALTLTYSQAYRALHTVRAKSPAGHPLVEEVPRGWFANPASDTVLSEYVAAEHGTDGRAADRAEKHQAERARRAERVVYEAVRTWYGWHIEGTAQPAERNGAERAPEAPEPEPRAAWQTAGATRRGTAGGVPRYPPDKNARNSRARGAA